MKRTFRTRPVIKEAIQWRYSSIEPTENNFDEILEFCGDAIELQTFFGLYVKTLEGKMHVSNGDWIIKGLKGEFYPCKPDIFEKTYEAVE